jgi:hypothetical protein
MVSGGFLFWQILGGFFLLAHVATFVLSTFPPEPAERYCQSAAVTISEVGYVTTMVEPDLGQTEPRAFRTRRAGRHAFAQETVKIRPALEFSDAFLGAFVFLTRLFFAETITIGEQA